MKPNKNQKFSTTREKFTQIKQQQKELLITLLLGVGGLSFIALIFALIFNLIKPKIASLSCIEPEQIIMDQIKLKNLVNQNQPKCYLLNVEKGDKIIINYNNPEVMVTLLSPNQKPINISQSFLVKNAGKYDLIIHTDKNQEKFDIDLEINRVNNKNISQDSLDNNSDRESQLKTNQKSVNSTPTDQHKTSTLNNQFKPIPNLAYKPNNSQTFYLDSQLNKIVSQIVEIAKNRGLPTEKLSISLVDLTSQNQGKLPYASYLDTQPRYPASIVKLFWMPVLFAQYETGILPKNKISPEILAKMLKDSDNEAASMVLDAITNTTSGVELSLPEIKQWQNQRESVNQFFQYAGYRNINISQKTFPIPYLQMNLPTGRDAQIRSENLQIPEKEVNPIRNYLTTHDTARLLLEIRANQAISPYYSNRIDELLTRDLNPSAWQTVPYNAIEGFLGQNLPPNIHFASKMGWTFSNRNDAAIIASPDRKAHYILVIFGDDPAYYKDKTFLPEVSEIVYQQMTNKIVTLPQKN